MHGLRREVDDGDGNLFGERAAVGQAEDAELRTLGPGVVAPVERRVDDDLAADPRLVGRIADRLDHAGAVGAGNDGQLDAGVEPELDPQVAVVECGSLKAYDSPARRG